MHAILRQNIPVPVWLPCVGYFGIVPQLIIIIDAHGFYLPGVIKDYDKALQQLKQHFFFFFFFWHI